MIGVWLGALIIGLAYAAACFPGATGAAAPWLMTVGIPVLLVSLILLATRRKGAARLPSILVLGLGFLGLVLLLGFGAALALPPETSVTPLYLGLPRRAALVIYGIGILPVGILPLVFALSFDRVVLSEEELRDLRDKLSAG